MGHLEDRTHGVDSAIDDEMPPAANMTDTADARQPIPGADAIPADMPNAPHGDMPLTYDLQTFNALVAANTAMQTEISSLHEKIGLIEEQRDSHKGAAIEARADARAYLAQIKDLQQVDRDSRERLDAAASELLFAQQERAALQRRLDRSLGYLDRVLDDEDGIRAGETRTVPAPKPPVGPALGEIPDPVRTRTSRDADGWMPSAARISAEPFPFGEMQASRRRRY